MHAAIQIDQNAIYSQLKKVNGIGYMLVIFTGESNIAMLLLIL